MKRIRSLDALRGLASLSVVFAHVHGIFFSHHIFADLTPLRIFWSGGEAVILFFVLSGYVLSAPYFQKDGLSYGRFLAARSARIYIPYLASILLCLLLSLLVFDPIAAQTHHFLERRWPHPIELQLLLSHAGLIGDFNTQAYNEVIWSLVHEMRFAIIFPLFLLMIRVLRWKTCLIVAFSISVAAILCDAANIDSSVGFKSSYLYSFHYLLFFVIGGLLVKNTEAIGSRFSELTPRQGKLLFATGIALYVYSFSVYSLPVDLDWHRVAQFGSFAADWGVGLGSAILIAFATYSKTVSSFLDRKLFILLGKISFSLYLVHVPVLAAAMHLLGTTRVIIVVLIALPFVFLAAFLFYYAVELPAHKLGKFLSKRTKTRELALT